MMKLKTFVTVMCNKNMNTKACFVLVMIGLTQK